MKKPCEDCCEEVEESMLDAEGCCPECHADVLEDDDSLFDVCPDCNGSGEGSNEFTRCWNCKGKGTVISQ